MQYKMHIATGSYRKYCEKIVLFNYPDAITYYKHVEM